MKKLVSTLNLDKKEWLKYRKGGIGGSDAGAICGLNPYRTAIQVYSDKRTGRRIDMNNERNIIKSMADILCQQHLITPDEKSRLILLIDEERE